MIDIVSIAISIPVRSSGGRSYSNIRYGRSYYKNDVATWWVQIYIYLLNIGLIFEINSFYGLLMVREKV